MPLPLPDFLALPATPTYLGTPSSAGNTPSSAGNTPSSAGNTPSFISPIVRREIIDTQNSLSQDEVSDLLRSPPGKVINNGSGSPYQSTMMEELNMIDAATAMFHPESDYIIALKKNGPAIRSPRKKRQRVNSDGGKTPKTAKRALPFGDKSVNFAGVLGQATAELDRKATRETDREATREQFHESSRSIGEKMARTASA